MRAIEFSVTCTYPFGVRQTPHSRLSRMTLLRMTAAGGQPVYGVHRWRLTNTPLARFPTILLSRTTAENDPSMKIPARSFSTMSFSAIST